MSCEQKMQSSSHWKPWTVSGVWLVTVTLTLLSLSSFAVAQTNPNIRQQEPRSQVNPNSGQQSRAIAGRRQEGQTSQTNANTQRQLLNYPHDLSLNQMTPEMLDDFLASEDDVAILTNCFESVSTCRSKHAINLIKQLQDLGIGGRCKNCTSKEQEHLDDLIYSFIQKFIDRYPKYWRTIVPNIGNGIKSINVGPSSGNAGPSSHNAGQSSGNAGPSSHNAGQSSGNAGPSSHNAGQSSGNAGPSSG
ncbi:Insect odorant-binding protein A10/Ejaculatory bulb-specific protein 3 [Trinorchestia longiramus]|nr:Insect odorant-binding protein A10/Ejaculatory bulb-specific protein 3 [Trinorchestia longiramus]